MVYLRHDGKERLARIYQPAGIGPFPAVVQVHGGAWNTKDRTDGQHASMDLAAAGIVVMSIDFRNAPEAPYPASLQDINFAFRWLKANAGRFGSRADKVGTYGTSTGGHQALLAAIRPEDPRYRAIELVEAPTTDARLAFVITGWGVIFPLERYRMAQARNKTEIVRSHEIFFGDESTQIEATPADVIDRKEDVYLPPTFLFQGTEDEWIPVEQVERLAASYRGAGGKMEIALFEGEPHTFLNDQPYSANSIQAFSRIVDFIRKQAGG